MSASMNPFGQKKPTVGGFPDQGSSGSGQKPAFGGFGSTPTQLGDEAPPTFYWKKTDTEKPVRSCIQNDYEPPKGSSGSGQKKPAFGGFGSTPTQLGDEGAPTIVQFFAEKPSPTYPFKPGGTYIPGPVLPATATGARTLAQIFAEKPSPTNPFKSLPDKAFRLF